MTYVPNTPEIPDTMIVKNLETFKAYIDPLRRQIVELLIQPRSVRQIAELLEVPFTRLYYHMRILEKHNIIRVVDTRHVLGGVEEKYYYITARMFVLDRETLTQTKEQSDSLLEAVFNASIDLVRFDVVNAVKTGSIDLKLYPPHPKALMLRYGSVQVSDIDAQRIQERLLEILHGELDFIEAIDPDGEKKIYHLLVGFYAD